MNTPQTWSDSPIHEQIRTMSTDTPETDEALSTAECESDLVIRMRRMERERDEAQKSLEFQRKLNVELNERAKCDLQNMTEQRDRYKLACDQYSEDESLCKLHEVTEQRDELKNEILGWNNKWQVAVEMAALAQVERDDMTLRWEMTNAQSDAPT